MSLLCYPLFLLYKLLDMFQATMCPSSGDDDCVVLSPCVGVVPWLQEGCQNRLAGSVSIEEFVAQLQLCWGLPAPIQLLPAMMQSFMKIVIRSITILLTTVVLRTPQWTLYLLTGSDSPPAATAQYLDTLPANRFRQPSCSHGTIPTHGDNTTQSPAPEDGHMVARNMLSNL